MSAAVVDPSLVFIPDKVAQNNETVYRVRTMAALLAGVAAGILGITGFYGLIFFFLHALIVALALDRLTCHGNTTAYFATGKKQLMSLGEMSSGALTYILVWTLVYDSIYIF